MQVGENHRRTQAQGERGEAKCAGIGFNHGNLLNFFQYSCTATIDKTYDWNKTLLKCDTVSMKPLIFEVTQVGAGTLCIMPRPNADHLPETFAFLKQLGIHKVVCLMETAEMEAYGLAEEATQCSAAGLTFTHFPIPDRPPNAKR
jgi:hypothetical protein